MILSTYQILSVKGYFTNNLNARVALSNYFDYVSLDELESIRSCTSANQPLLCLEKVGMGVSIMGFNGGQNRRVQQRF